MCFSSSLLTIFVISWKVIDYNANIEVTPDHKKFLCKCYEVYHVRTEKKSSLPFRYWFDIFWFPFLISLIYLQIYFRMTEKFYWYKIIYFLETQSDCLSISFKKLKPQKLKTQTCSVEFMILKLVGSPVLLKLL